MLSSSNLMAFRSILVDGSSFTPDSNLTRFFVSLLAESLELGFLTMLITVGDLVVVVNFVVLDRGGGFGFDLTGLNCLLLEPLIDNRLVCFRPSAPNGVEEMSVSNSAPLPFPSKELLALSRPRTILTLLTSSAF